jgi:hypothetical protein
MSKANAIILSLIFVPLILAAQSRKSAGNLSLNHTISLAYQGGWSETDDFVLGAGLRYQIASPLGDFWQVGLLTGAENFNIAEGELLFPIFGMFSFQFNDGNQAPFISAGGGYSFVALFSGEPDLGSEGGIGGEFQAGFRFKITDSVRLLTSLGFRYQEATFLKRAVFTTNDVIFREYQYRRIMLNLGLNF